MTLAISLGCLTLCVAIIVGLAVALMRVRVDNATLRAALAVASEVQRNKDSLLSQRSQLDTIKDEFISTVSHELRTPLTSIRGALGLLSAGLMGDVDAKAQHLLRIAVTNTDRLIRLINDILDLERMESGRAPLQMRRCSLRDLAQQGIETMTAMADSFQVKLLLELETGPESVFFDGDPDRVLQVITNLLSNAIKFSPAAGTVTVGINADAHSVILRVTDQGRGIPVEKLESVFDRFQQVEASDARQKGGTGLGLAICRTIVQQHEGSIWAESNNAKHRGPGATLIVSLPRTSRADDLARKEQDSLRENREHCVILCDDDEGVRSVVGEHLRQHHYRILEASSGEDAIRLAEAHAPEAILLDLYMPGIGGWETLRRLKESTATAQIPVVILSVLSPATSSAGASAGTAQGWVQKPFNERTLLTELSRVLDRGDGPARVLLVEDDSDLASVVLTGFSEASIHVDHATSLQAAIDHCLLSPPDLLILDLTLLDGDGFALVAWLRQQPELCALPLVVYSGREVSDPERASLRLGPTEFLTKAKVQPREVEELVYSIVQRLRKKQPPSSDRRRPTHPSAEDLEHETLNSGLAIPPDPSSRHTLTQDATAGEARARAGSQAEPASEPEAAPAFRPDLLNESQSSNPVPEQSTH
jgi:signal transduction histidine kinase/DNA-binding response OmpR family regulator